LKRNNFIPSFRTPTLLLKAQSKLVAPDDCTLVKGEARRPRDGDLEKNFLNAFFATNEDEGPIL